MRLGIAEIKAMTVQVLDAVAVSGTPGLDQTDGLYWSLDSVEAWQMAQMPQCQTGDLADDISDVRRDLTEYLEADPQISWHTLDHLIGILTALSWQHKVRLGLDDREDV